MVPKSAFAAVVCIGFLVLGAPAMADEYRPSEFLGLDLSKAVLSPKRLGPEAEFAPIAIEAKTDRAQVDTDDFVWPTFAAREPKAAKSQIVRTRAEPPRAAARVKLAQRRGNPLDAQARDTRILTWPCKSGSICGWQR